MEGEQPLAASADQPVPSPAEPSAPATPAPAAATDAPAPASPPFTEVPLAPAAAITSVEAEAGANKCPYCDVPTLTNLGEALFSASVDAAILSTTGNVFEKAEPRIQPLFAELCTALKGQTTGGTLPELKGHIDKFVEAKRTLLSKLLTKEMLREKGQTIKANLARGDSEWVNVREKATMDILRLYDKGGVAHCNLCFESHEALNSHKAACAFRPTPCNNVGCLEVNSLQKMRDHDAICVFKQVPCEQGCAELVARREMRAHCLGPCLKRPVECPFFHIGCNSPVTLGSLDEHLQHNVVQHVSLFLEAFKDRSKQMDSHAAQLATLSIAVGSKLENTLGDMSKRQTNHTEKINAQAATLHSLQNAHSSAERELKGAKGEISSLREELKKSKAETAQLQKDILALRGLVVQELKLDAKAGRS